MSGQPSFVEASSRDHGDPKKGYRRRPEEYEGDPEPGRVRSTLIFCYSSNPFLLKVCYPTINTYGDY